MTKPPAEHIQNSLGSLPSFSFLFSLLPFSPFFFFLFLPAHPSSSTLSTAIPKRARPATPINPVYFLDYTWSLGLFSFPSFFSSQSHSRILLLVVWSTYQPAAAYPIGLSHDPNSSQAPPNSAACPLLRHYSLRLGLRLIYISSCSFHFRLPVFRSLFWLK